MTLVRMPDTYSGDAGITLAADITSGALSITLTSAFVFMASYTAGQFAIEIHDAVGGANSEWILIDSLSSLVLTVNASGRGYGGTTAHAHSTGDPVALVALEEQLVRIVDGRSIAPLDVTLTEETTPATPDTGTQTVFIDSADHTLKTVDHSGTVTPIGSGMTNPMTTQDDLIVGGASGTPARLAKGSDGQVLTVDPVTHHLVWATPTTPPSALDDLTDVTAPSPADRDVLLWDAGSSAWVNDQVDWADLTGTPTLPAYTITNDLTDRVYDADATTTDELADVLATLIRDLGAAGMGGGGGGGSVAIKRIVRQASGNYTTSSSTFVDIDGTNLTLDLTLAIGDIVEVSLTGQRLYDGGNAGYYDVRVIQPDTTSVRCNNSSDHGAVGYFTARDGVSLTVYFTATQAGAHTFRPQYLAVSGTETFCNSGTGGSEQTGIAFAVKNFGPSA